ncbi:MAG: acyl-CoA carboxylase subunit beta [Desulfobacteraceae bacterium]|nr:MAG: acyl-CoA carboxylase subunit beta [Desulfobacteraceae bacterium]
MNQKLDLLNQKRQAAEAGGGPKAVQSQHEKGKMSARERVAAFFDPGTFEEMGAMVTHRCNDFGLEDKRYLGDSVVTGYGKVNGRTVFIFAQDFTVLGGSLSKVASEKICKAMDLAASSGAPIVGLLDSGGARIQEGVDSLQGYGDIFTRNILYSGVVPQISVIMGPCAGGAVYSPALTDFIFMVKGMGQMYITGPNVIKAVTGEEVSLEQLGGAMTHASKSGNAHFVADNEQECLDMVKRLLSFLPGNNMDDPPVVPSNDPPDRRDEAMTTIVPPEPSKSYDMKKVIAQVVDGADFLEVHKHFAKNLITGFARMNGQPVGIIAQQPQFLAGSIDVDASDKGARFVRTCDCYNVPLITFADVPGYMPGTEQEYRGIIRHGAKFLYAYCEATVPKVCVITRKAYGGAFIVMSSKSLRGDINYGWPTAEIAVMGPDGAVDVVFRDAIKNAANPQEARQKTGKKAHQHHDGGGSCADVIDLLDDQGKLLGPENKKERLQQKDRNRAQLVDPAERRSAHPVDRNENGLNRFQLGAHRFLINLLEVSGFWFQCSGSLHVEIVETVAR